MDLMSMLLVPGVLTAKVGELDQNKVLDLLKKTKLPIKAEHAVGILAILNDRFPPDTKVYDALPKMTEQLQPMLELMLKSKEAETEDLSGLVRCPHCNKGFVIG